MNVKLLRKVARHIAAEPRRLDMNRWMRASRSAPCGTAACIAGWACLLEEPEKTRAGNANDGSYCFGRGARLLKLGSLQMERLFLPSRWPRQFRGGRNSEERAKRATARIRHFIATHGKE